MDLKIEMVFGMTYSFMNIEHMLRQKMIKNNIEMKEVQHTLITQQERGLQ